MKTVVTIAVLALLCSGCAVAAGTALGGLAGGVIGNSLQRPKPDTPVDCPSCVHLSDGMTWAEYEQLLREKLRQEHGLPSQNQQ